MKRVAKPSSPPGSNAWQCSGPFAAPMQSSLSVAAVTVVNSTIIGSPEGHDCPFQVAHPTHVHRLTRHFLEPAQDILVLAIGLALFGLMVRTIAWLILQIFKPTLDFRQVITEVLFMLVMVEVVRLVISYLKEHRVAVDFMVELGIVATLREIVLRGVTDLAWQQLLALTMFVLALGALLRFGDLRSPYVPDREETLPQSGVKVSG